MTITESSIVKDPTVLEKVARLLILAASQLKPEQGADRLRREKEHQ